MIRCKNSIFCARNVEYRKSPANIFPTNLKNKLAFWFKFFFFFFFLLLSKKLKCSWGVPWHPTPGFGLRPWSFTPPPNEKSWIRQWTVKPLQKWDQILASADQSQMHLLTFHFHGPWGHTLCLGILETRNVGSCDSRLGTFLVFIDLWLGKISLKITLLSLAYV